MENKKKKLVEFYFSKRIYYLIIYGIFLTIASILYKILGLDNTPNIYNASNISFLLSLLQILGWILYKIKKKNSEQENSLSTTNIIIDFFENQKYIYDKKQNKNRKRKKKKKILLIICSICECLRYFFAIYQTEYKDVSYYLSGFNMIVILIVSLYFLKKHNYRHHHFAISLIFLSDFSLTILDNNNYKKFLFDYFETQKSHVIDFTFVPLKICLEKYLMLYLVSNAFKILFIEGIIQSLIYLFGFVILFFFSNDFLIQERIFFKHFIDNFLYYIFFLLSFFFSKILELLINDIFEPIYIILGCCSFVLVQPIKILLNNQDYSILKIILYVITYLTYLIAIMIFSEVIIINICKLGQNTKKYIALRCYTDERTKSEDYSDEENPEKIKEIINNIIL